MSDPIFSEGCTVTFAPHGSLTSERSGVPLPKRPKRRKAWLGRIMYSGFERNLSRLSIFRKAKVEHGREGNEKVDIRDNLASAKSVARIIQMKADEDNKFIAEADRHDHMNDRLSSESEFKAELFS